MRLELRTRTREKITQAEPIPGPDGTPSRPADRVSAGAGEGEPIPR